MLCAYTIRSFTVHFNKVHNSLKNNLFDKLYINSAVELLKAGINYSRLIEHVAKTTVI